MYISRWGGATQSLVIIETNQVYFSVLSSVQLCIFHIIIIRIEFFSDYLDLSEPREVEQNGKFFLLIGLPVEVRCDISMTLHNVDYFPTLGLPY